MIAACRLFAATCFVALVGCFADPRDELPGGDVSSVDHVE